MKNGLSIDEVNAIYTLSEKCPFRTSNQSKLNLIYESALQHNLKTYSLYCKILMITVIYQKRLIVNVVLFHRYDFKTIWRFAMYSYIEVRSILAISCENEKCSFCFKYSKMVIYWICFFGWMHFNERLQMFHKTLSFNASLVRSYHAFYMQDYDIMQYAFRWYFNPFAFISRPYSLKVRPHLKNEYYAQPRRSCIISTHIYLLLWRW